MSNIFSVSMCVLIILCGNKMYDNEEELDASVSLLDDTRSFRVSHHLHRF